MEDPAFVAELRARWAKLRHGPLSDAELSAQVAALAAPLQNAAQRNFQRWPNLSFSGNYGVTGVAGLVHHGMFVAMGTLKIPIFHEAKFRGDAGNYRCRGFGS